MPDDGTLNPGLIWLIRHAERLDHGEIPSEGLGLPPLSQQGWQEAEALAAEFTGPPDLIVTSSYVRTRQTAAPLRRRFPSVPVEEWPVQEITFLHPGRFRGTTIREREAESAAYWRRNNPQERAGPGAESFVEFVARVDDFLDRLRTRPGRFIAVISHGYTLQAVLWRLEKPGVPADAAAMADYTAFRQGIPLGNCAIIPLARGSSGIIRLSGTILNRPGCTTDPAVD